MVADAVTSVFAIVALIAGKYMGWDFLDALLGIIGSILVAKWALALMKEAGKTLLGYPAIDAKDALRQWAILKRMVNDSKK